jgi:mono/diheme cytochrome c family protein
MSEESNSSHSDHDTSGHGVPDEPEYGPTYYAPVEMPIPRLPRPPFWMISLALISVVATWLPLAVIARARVSLSSEPRVQIAQDMGLQPKFREQETNSLFVDDRAMRPKIPGTVARGSLELDDNYYRGFVRRNDGDGKYTIVFAGSLPSKLAGTPKAMKALLERGQQRFNIYCYVCHGYDGSGHGPVNERAMQLKAIDTDQQHPIGVSWTPAAQLYSDTIRAEPDGKIFNTITNGIRTMPSYYAQIPVDDRWAIVAYVRALQLSQGGMPTGSLTPEQLDVVKGQ